MKDINTPKTLQLSNNNELIIEDYKEKNIKNNQNWINPLSNWTLKSSYGMRFHPIFKQNKFHDGIDMGVPINIPIRAVDDGVVVYAGWYNGYGKYIEIDHGDELHSFYGHLNKIDVSLNAMVYQGDIIGLSGNTGNSTGPHLHFGAKRNKKSVDPNVYLP